MYYHEVLENIAKRSYNTAAARGKDVSCEGCAKYLSVELAEYWEAVENDRQVNDPEQAIKTAAELGAPEFAEYYAANIHNTNIDELADLMITAATLTHAAILRGDEAMRSVDVILADGIVAFIVERLNRDKVRPEDLRNMVNLKMRYNETRKD